MVGEDEIFGLILTSRAVLAVSALSLTRFNIREDAAERVNRQLDHPATKNRDDALVCKLDISVLSRRYRPARLIVVRRFINDAYRCSRFHLNNPVHAYDSIQRVLMVC